MSETPQQLETAKLQREVDFYSRRCRNLQTAQSKMRDPERKWVCDILANGYAEFGFGLGAETVDGPTWIETARMLPTEENTVLGKVIVSDGETIGATDLRFVTEHCWPFWFPVPRVPGRRIE